MRITDIRTTAIIREVTKPVMDGMWRYDAGGLLIVRVVVENGVIGYATSNFGRIRSGVFILQKLIEEELVPAIIGQSIFNARGIRKLLWDAAHYHDVVGLAQFGIAALDIATWDSVGKTLNLPCAKVAGACRDSIPAYAMVGWYYESERELVENCEQAVAEGFRALKIKVGRYDLQNDLERIRLVRRSVGENITLMVDANQALDFPEAVRRGRAYEQEGLYWFEEPMPPQMVEHHVRLAQKLDIPIAIGENHYTRFQFHEAIRAGMMDIVQPDNRRSGGFTEWLEIGAIADAAGLKLASHGGGPANVNMLCTIPNAIYLESGSIKNENKMQKHKLELVDGRLLLPEVPGMGTEVDEDYVSYLVKRMG